MDTQKSSIISIVGKPNAGKSTLLNKVIGQRISIITPKVQTTRNMIRGIVTQGDTQLVFIDTPGIFEPKKALEKAMVRAAWSSISGADCVLLIIDCLHDIDDMQKIMISRIKDHTNNLIVLLNKIDLSTKNLDHIKKSILTIIPDVIIFDISAENGDGVDKLMSFLVANSPKNHWLYEEDDITTLPLRFLAAELTREQLFLSLKQELPYNLTVETETWEEFDNGSVKIRQAIIVSRETYKIIILGKNGSMIKAIGQKARENIEEYLSIKAHLFLFVKVRENWDTALCKSI